VSLAARAFVALLLSASRALKFLLRLAVDLRHIAARQVVVDGRGTQICLGIYFLKSFEICFFSRQNNIANERKNLKMFIRA
jgi:hypothetical protein